MKLIALAIILIATLAHSTPEVMGVDIASAHAHSGMNSINPGIYARWSNGLTAGSYYNSERRMTVWGGYTLHDSDDRFALMLGVGTGYGKRRFTPMVIPSVRLGLNETTSVRLSLAAAKNNPAVHLSIEKRF